MSRPVWTWTPNWSDGVVERLIWLTDVQTSRDGTEERHRTRQTPRRTIQFSTIAEGYQAQRLDAHLWGEQLGEWLMPLWWDPSRLDSELAAGSKSVAAPTEHRDFRAGADSWIVLLDPRTSRYHASAVDTLASGAIGLVTGPAESWPTGSLIYPARIVHLEPGQRVSRQTAGVVSTEVKAEVVDTSAVPSSMDADGDGGHSNVDGSPVFDRQPNRSAPIDAEFQRIFARVDGKVGRFALNDLAGRPFVGRTHEHLIESRADMWSLRRWLEFTGGRHQAFWAPTFQADLSITRDISDGDSSIYVRRVDYASNYASQRGRRHIALRFRGGFYAYREITGATVIDATEEQLQINDIIDGNHSADELVVSWLEPVRQAADAVEIRHVTAEVAQVALPFKTIR